MSTMCLRTMEIDDLDQVAALEKTIFSVPWTKEGFLTYLLKEDSLFLVVEERGEILAYIGIICVLDEGDITNVAVKQERRKEGIGQFLIDSLLRMVKDQGIRKVHLEVRPSNEGARRLYKRSGFKEVGCRKGYYEAPKEDAILMTCHL